MLPGAGLKRPGTYHPLDMDNRIRPLSRVFVSPGHLDNDGSTGPLSQDPTLKATINHYTKWYAHTYTLAWPTHHSTGQSRRNTTVQGNHTPVHSHTHTHTNTNHST